MKLKDDKNVVMTLDAGGTNFVFSAIQGMREIIKPIRLPSNSADLEKCLATILEGFFKLKKDLPNKPVAISFAFPGPADYPSGIIGDLPNLPAFRGGIALGPMLEEKFNLPVFINNDGNLFALGESIAGLLPQTNNALKKAGSTKLYKNLLGVTLGTGFGGGFVSNGELLVGDNSSGTEIWLMRSDKKPKTFADEVCSIRAIQRFYAQKTNQKHVSLTPKQILQIAIDKRTGMEKAAKETFVQLGHSVGEALAKAITLFDGLVVVGGGLSGAAEFFLPSLVEQMNRPLFRLDGEKLPGLSSHVFNLENKNDFDNFAKKEMKILQIPKSNKKISFDPTKKIGVGISRLGTNEAIAIGAYAFALENLK